MSSLRTPHDLITAVPFLIGFHPSNSIVIISIKDGALGLTMRCDLPASITGEEVDLLAHHCIRDGADTALLIAYMPENRSDGDHLLISIGAGLIRNGISIGESIVISGGRYKSIICRDSSCCPESGNTLPVIEDSQIAVEHVIAGIPMPYADISELIGTIAPDDQSREVDWLERVSAFEISDSDPELPALRRDGVEAMELLLDEFRIGRGATDQQLVARVLGRLSHVHVRDYAMGAFTEDTYDLTFAMWRELLRVAPTGFIAPVASLVAAMSYEGGDGALAQRAIDRALDDDSDYPLALLLRRVFNAGWPPESFSAMRAELHPKILATIF